MYVCVLVCVCVSVFVCVCLCVCVLGRGGGGSSVSRHLCVRGLSYFVVVINYHRAVAGLVAAVSSPS